MYVCTYFYLAFPQTIQLVPIWMCLPFSGRDNRENTHPVLPFSLRVFPDDWLKTGHENLAGVLKINI